MKTIKLKNLLNEGFGDPATIDKRKIESYIVELRKQSKKALDYSKKMDSSVGSAVVRGKYIAYSTVAKELTKLLKRS